MAFRPMKGDTLDGAPRYPLIAMPKIDGIRCVMIDGAALSNSLKPLPNRHLQALASHPALHGLDGELTLGDPTAEDVYRATNSAVMSQDGQPALTFRVFDLFDHPGGYQARLAALAEKVATLPAELREWIEIVPEQWITDAAGLDEFEAHWVGALGYEGIMIRCPEGPYKHGRATAKQGWLLKVKRFVDDEATIVGCTELMRNENAAYTNELGLTRRSTAQAGKVAAGLLGNLIAEWNGQQFEIGTGFSAAERAELWAQRDALPGQLVKFKYFPVGMKDAPRHPTYLGLRSPLDMTDY